jgi:hypothetical protein
MFQFFTAKVGKFIEIKNGKKRAGAVQLDVAGEQDANKVKVVSALVQALPTKGASRGVLLPLKEGVSAHLVFDIAFVRRLEPGTLLRVEWETRAGGIMTNITALARQK